MTGLSKIGSSRLLRTFIVFCLLVPGLVLGASLSGAAEQAIAPPAAGIQAFHPGETLTYDVSWSNVLSAGTVIMSVETEKLPDEREVLKFVVKGRTHGAVNRVFSVDDTVQSVFDLATMQSLSYSSIETHGKKTRRKSLDFDHVNRIVTMALNEDPLKTSPIPDRVQDNLSALYYLRTRDDFVVGKPITFEAFDSGSSVTVEIQTLGREQVKTPAGEFSTIKVKAYKGLFVSQGEIFVWLTDDSRKVPVLLKSTLKFGTLVFTLTDLKPGMNRQALLR